MPEMFVKSTNIYYNLCICNWHDGISSNRRDVYVAEHPRGRTFTSQFWDSNTCLHFQSYFLDIKVAAIIIKYLGLGTHLFVKVPRPGVSEVTFLVFESSCHLLLPV